MKKVLRTIWLIGEIFGMKHIAEFEKGKGPYSCIDEEDGTSWNLYRGSGVSYTYGMPDMYQ